MPPTDFDRRLATAVLEMAREASVPATVERALALATDAVPACDAAVVFVFDRTDVRTAVGEDPLLLDLVMQHVHQHDGLVTTVYESGEPVYLADTSAAGRWPVVARHLATVGICSVYAVPLRVDTRPLGVLGLYARKPHAFDCEDQETAGLVATHAAAALAGCLAREQLGHAIDSRTVIGQAAGIVMEQFGLDASVALQVLRRLSQDQNQKMRDIAAGVVATRTVA